MGLSYRKRLSSASQLASITTLSIISMEMVDIYIILLHYNILNFALNIILFCFAFLTNIGT